MNIFARAVNKLKKMKEDRRLREILGPVEGSETIRMGNDYGGFDLAIEPMEAVVKNRRAVVYSFGIGEDLSFSEAVFERWNCEIFAFDPTPKSVAYVRKHRLSKEDGFHFYEWGIAKEDGIGHFHLPKNEEYVSGSLLQHTDVREDSIEVALRSLKSIADELGHREIDLLKMDVEGTEFDVMDGILESGLRIRQICLEVHNRYFEDGLTKLEKMMNALKSHGFHTVSLDPRDLQEVTLVWRA